MEAVVGPVQWQPESCVDYIPEESPAKLTRNLTILITNESIYSLGIFHINTILGKEGKLLFEFIIRGVNTESVLIYWHLM